jgi:two-component system phosphate regulon response regulator PhoB
MLTYNQILIVEDEPSIQQMISFVLKRAGYDTTEVDSARKAWNFLKKNKPSLIILDWMLPDKTGILFLTELRKNSSFDNTPVIMLTARAEESSKIRGFDAGADDYITKPFSPKELVARVKTILKRYQPKNTTGETGNNHSKPILTYKGISMDPNERALEINSEKIKIAPLEFKLLYQLLKYANKAQSRDKLLENAWDDKTGITDRTVDVHIRRVRKLLEPSSYDKNIESIRGIGYRFIQES